MNYKQFTINLAGLQNIAEAISNGDITIKNASQNVPFNTPFGVRFFSVPESTLRFYFNTNKINYSARLGRPQNTVSSKNEEIILYFHHELNSGETVTYHSVKAKFPSITSYEVHQTFLKYNLYSFKKEQKNEKRRCRYEALFVCQIWHADIHIFTDANMDQHLLYAIIDDKSRFIVGFDILSNKTQLETKRVLQSAISNYGPPAIMWTDNGGENKGDQMLAYLKEQRIYPHFTFPHNPQQNGKVESFWKKIDKCCQKVQDIPLYISKYNTIRSHTGLEKNQNGCYKRPADVFFDFNLRWQRHFEWNYLVDGKIKPFPYKKDIKTIYYD